MWCRWLGDGSQAQHSMLVPDFDGWFLISTADQTKDQGFGFSNEGNGKWETGNEEFGILFSNQMGNGKLE
jgi:hypothetical protein